MNMELAYILYKGHVLTNCHVVYEEGKVVVVVVVGWGVFCKGE